ncbi:MAG: hypothetical protein ACYTFG_02815 [Planctomycetota bacterium]|jgi:hypothetical protein
MINQIWEAHKRFIIGIAVGALFVLLAHQIAVAPLGKKATKVAKRSADNEKKLTALFNENAEEHPTPTTENKYRKAMARANTELDDARTAVGFPVQAPFLLPAGEGMPEAYYIDVFSKTKRKIQVAANSRAIDINQQVLQGRARVEDVAKALVALAVLERTLLTAIVSGVSSLDSVEFGSGERSAPIHNYRLDESLLTVTVRGTPASIQEWLRSLGRRESYLVIASASIKGPEKDSEDELVTAKVQLGPVAVSEVALPEDEEEE